MMPGTGSGHTWVLIGCVASTGAAAVHIAATRPHLQEWAPAGMFMLAGGIAQAVWAVWIVRSPSALALLAGVTGNASMLALWGVSRTIGMPAGPMPGVAEHIHTADLLATVCEVVIVAACFGLAMQRSAPIFALKSVTFLAAMSLLTGSHDPTREQFTALATLIGVGSATALAYRFQHLSVITVVRATISRTHLRRIDVTSTAVRRPVLPLRIASHAVVRAERTTSI